MGCDDPEGFGEGLRKKLLASQDFFRELRREIPELVIENCSSGGHRLEPSMMELSSMASFSDAHEHISIPLIAANLLRLVKASQNQIWAVLRAKDSDERIFFSLCATFMGRMGMSGDVYDLSPHQWQLVKDGMAFYYEIADIIKLGKPIFIDTDVKKYNNPLGTQLVVLQREDTYLAILHKFDKPEIEKSYIEEANGYVNIYGGLNLLGLTVEKSYGSTDGYNTAKAWLLRKN